MFKKIKTRRVFEYIALQIREAILEGRLNPGDKLPPEITLAEEFGVGRPTIREAMRTLEISGLIAIQQGKNGGAYVQNGDLNSLKSSFSDLLQLGNITLFDLTEARVPIESSMFNLMEGRINSIHIATLRNSLSKSEKLHHIGNDENRINENLNFHVILAKITENPLIIINVSTIVGLMNCFLKEIRPNPKIILETMNAHSKIVDHLENNELDQARKEDEQHILKVTERLVKLCRGDRKIRQPDKDKNLILKDIYIQ